MAWTGCSGWQTGATGWRWWQWWTNRAQVTSVSVAVAPQTGCDVEFDVVATVYTNGKAGKIVYQWERSDGRRTEIGLGSLARSALSAAVHAVAPKSAVALLADPKLFGVSCQVLAS